MKKRDAALQKERDEVRAAQKSVDDARANLVQDARAEKARALKEVEAARAAFKAEAEEARAKTEEQRGGVAKQLRLKSEKLEALEKELRRELDKKSATLDETRELLRRDRAALDARRAEAETARAAAAEDRAAAGILKGETEGHHKAALGAREDLNRRAKALDHREEQLRNALVDLREREDKAGAAIAKSSALAQEHERRIQSLAAKELAAEQRERQAAQQSAAAEATLLAAGQWERHAGEREAARAARGKELEATIVATENAGREVRRELDAARAARASLADADAALAERDDKLNSNWMTLQSEMASMIRGAAGSDGIAEVPTEAKVAHDVREAAAGPLDREVREALGDDAPHVAAASTLMTVVLFSYITNEPFISGTISSGNACHSSIVRSFRSSLPPLPPSSYEPRAPSIGRPLPSLMPQ